MNDPIEINLTILFENDWFTSLLSPFLSFGDLRDLSKSNKVAKAIVQSLTASWPNEIRELNRTWCKKPGESLIIMGNHKCCTRIHEGVVQLRHPTPMIKFQVDTLSYDTEIRKLRGQPWSEVIPKNQPPNDLGRQGCYICYANDAKTQIFVCGGECSAPKVKDKSILTWFDETAFSLFISKATGLFDLETGHWTELPPTPDFFPGSGGIFRIGAKVYIIICGEPILRFDLEHRRWESWLNNSCICPLNEGMEVVVINENKVIVAGGISEDNEAHRRNEESREVYSLNMVSGMWTRLPDLPAVFASRPSVEKTFSCCLNDDTLCIMNSESWATLSHGGEWQMNPDLEGEGLKAVILGDFMFKVFAGNTWVELPPHDEHNFDGLINEYWRTLNGLHIK